MNIETLLAARARTLDVSGIRRIFELGAKLKDPINLSIGQPDFPVPANIKQAAMDAIARDENGYTLTQGIESLRSTLEESLARDIGWNFGEQTGVVVTSGTSGALVLAFMALLDPGDEVVIPDPYFLVYPSLAEMFGAHAVRCDTYPDFRLTAERVEPLISDRTKIVLMNSPSNPAGVVASVDDCLGLLELCRSKGVVLISDEIYDAFTYSDARTQASPQGVQKCPSPARFEGSQRDMLLVRGFGKTYGCTGWRLGYAAGDRRLITEMAKFQQYTFVCAPAPLQHAAIEALHTDMGPTVADYEQRRDLVFDRLSNVTELPRPGGAFYAFFKVPERLGMTGTEFAQACIERNLLVIPGGVFSERDTHIRLSFAAPAEKLEAGLDVLVEMMNT